jgi:DNA-directed RNA polymerase specialized sigma24 family protein
MGMKQADIADRLGVTVKAVERMVANHRNRMRRRGIA